MRKQPDWEIASLGSAPTPTQDQFWCRLHLEGVSLGIDKAVSAMSAFCGNDLCTNVKIVTTFWRGEGAELKALNERLEERKGVWFELLERGVQHHAFGKRYVNGTATEEIISWYDDASRDELASQARDLVTDCHGSSAPVLQVLQELFDEHRLLKDTKAGKVLRAYA